MLGNFLSTNLMPLLLWKNSNKELPVVEGVIGGIGIGNGNGKLI